MRHIGSYEVLTYAMVANLSFEKESSLLLHVDAMSKAMEQFKELTPARNN